MSTAPAPLDGPLDPQRNNPAAGRGPLAVPVPELATVDLTSSVMSKTPTETLTLEPGVARVGERIRELLPLLERPIVVGVAGGSASGKTEAVAVRIAKLFGDDALLLSIDDYQRGVQFIKDEAAKGRVLTFDHPEFVNFELLKEHLKLLTGGAPIEKPIYSFKTGEPDTSEIVHPKRILVVEGLFALREELRDVLDCAVFVEAGTHGRALRRLLRDLTRTGRDPGKIINYFAETVEPLHQHYIQPLARNAELVILNDYNPAIESVRAGTLDAQRKFRGRLSSESIVAAGGTLLWEGEQKDEYRGRHDIDLAASGECIRLRTSAQGEVFAYRGPHLPGAAPQRWKFEVQSNQSISNGTRILYPEVETRITKHRAVFDVDGVFVAIDSGVTRANRGNPAEDLGSFVEVRCPNGSYERIDAVCAKLGLDPARAVKGDYNTLKL